MREESTEAMSRSLASASIFTTLSSQNLALEITFGSAVHFCFWYSCATGLVLNRLHRIPKF